MLQVPPDQKNGFHWSRKGTVLLAAKNIELKNLLLADDQTRLKQDFFAIRFYS